MAHSKPCYMLEHPKSLSDFLGDTTEDVTMGNQQATQVNLAWLAGIIDGEGYIGFQKQRSRKGEDFWYNAALEISNTDEEIILRAKEILRKLGVNVYTRTWQYGSKNKVQYKLTAHRMAQLVKVLPFVLPNLTGNKKERAKLVLEFCNSRLKTLVRGSHKPQPYTEREQTIVNLCIPRQKRGASETTRKAELEKSVIWAEQDARHSNRKLTLDDIVRPAA